MRLGHLAEGVAGAAVQAGARVDVRAVVHDSRSAGPGDLFVAVRGLRADGHDFAAAAAARGAAVAVERPVPLPAGTAWLRLADTRLGLAELSAELHGRPARRLRVVGVTGTAGKSTTTHLVASALEAAGLPAGYLSSVALRSTGPPADNESGQTTLEPPQVQAWLARMVAGGAAAAVLEVSSHALEQGRVAACDFDVAAFTNVREDHLEYHGSPEAYLRAKARLIELCASGSAKGRLKTAVLNRDDTSFEDLEAYPIQRRLTYGMAGAPDVRAAALRPVRGGTAFVLHAGDASVEVRLQLPGRFNVANAACAAACGLALGLPLDRLALGLTAFPGLRGRLERVDLGQPVHALRRLRALRRRTGQRAGRAAARHGRPAAGGVRRELPFRRPRSGRHGPRRRGDGGLLRDHDRRPAGRRPGRARPPGRGRRERPRAWPGLRG